MPTITESHLKNLRCALLKLRPTGSTGFEGFLEAVLTEACGQPFRLASSGSQRGRDGDSAFDAGATYFEAKRFRDNVPKAEVAAKIMDIKIDDRGQVDTWIIASTAPIPALHAEDFRRLAEVEGIGIVLLDWPKNAVVPALATLVVMAGEAAKQFLRTHIGDGADGDLLSEALDAIDHISSLSAFTTQSARLAQELTNPSVGLGLAKAANRSWLERAFSSKAIARQQFGQPLAPFDGN